MDQVLWIIIWNSETRAISVSYVLQMGHWLHFNLFLYLCFKFYCDIWETKNNDCDILMFKINIFILYVCICVYVCVCMCMGCCMNAHHNSHRGYGAHGTIIRRVFSPSFYHVHSKYQFQTVWQQVHLRIESSIVLLRLSESACLNHLPIYWLYCIYFFIHVLRFLVLFWIYAIIFNHPNIQKDLILSYRLFSFSSVTCFFAM